MVDRGRLDISKDLSFVDPRIRAQAPSDRMELLHTSYSPGYWDVICQGGKENYDHIGNRRFRICIDNNLNTYIKARSKHEKSLVVTRIVDSIRDSTPRIGGGFVRKDLVSGRWYDVGDKIAREKVGHALRDAIKLKTKNEKSSRMQQQQSCEKKSSSVRPCKRKRSSEITSSSPINVSAPIHERPTISPGSDQRVVDTVSPNCISSDSTTLERQNLHATASKLESMYPNGWNGLEVDEHSGCTGNVGIQTSCNPTNGDIEKALRDLQAKVSTSNKSSQSTDGGSNVSLRNRGGWNPPTNFETEKQYQTSLESLKLKNGSGLDMTYQIKGQVKQLGPSQVLKEPQSLDPVNQKNADATSHVNKKSRIGFDLISSSNFVKGAAVNGLRNNVNGNIFQQDGSSSMDELLQAFANKPAVIGGGTIVTNGGFQDATDGNNPWNMIELPCADQIVSLVEDSF